ncbi:MAG: outer membrane lipoprotein-sorting protein [Elusimicrobiales bacterium]|nr:outer membrane lipoprotein-sorting protein [Elusimicrobiales bacterium]
MNSFLIVFALMSSPGFCAAGADTGADIVKKADAVRNPEQPFSVVNSLTEYREGKETNQMAITVYSKKNSETNQYQSIAAFSAPAKDKGKVMLKNGNELWFYDPLSKASTRISPQQRLMGQASNGDIMTTNLHADYKAELAGDEIIADMSKAKVTCHKLNLKSAGNNGNYYRIEYWVDKSNCHPVKAKFYSDSDRLLRIVYFGGYKTELGGLRPTEVIIIDGVDRNFVTKMFFSNYEYKRIPPEWFQKDYLPRFKAQ